MKLPKVAAALAVLLTLTGCGSETDGTKTTGQQTPTPTVSTTPTSQDEDPAPEPDAPVSIQDPVLGANPVLFTEPVLKLTGRDISFELPKDAEVKARQYPLCDRELLTDTPVVRGSWSSPPEDEMPTQPAVQDVVYGPTKKGSGEQALQVLLDCRSANAEPGAYAKVVGSAAHGAVVEVGENETTTRGYVVFSWNDDYVRVTGISYGEAVPPRDLAVAKALLRKQVDAS